MRSAFLIIIIAFVIRLFGITNPPLEKSHNWRQCFTLMVARNFNHCNFIQPESDINGGTTVAMEFPFYCYIIYDFNKFFGDADWHGRLINLIVSSFGLLFFYRIVRIICGHDLALFSLSLLTVSIFFAFSRKIMPDTFSISLTFAGIFYLIKYLKNAYHSVIYLFVALLLITTGLLTKIPSLTVLAFIIPFATDKTIALRYKIYAAAGFIPVALILYWWYGILLPYQIEQGSSQLIYTPPLTEAIHLLKINIAGVLEKFYFSGLCSYISFIFFITGISFALIRRNKLILILFIFSSIAFIGFIIKAAYFFHYHNYYIIPFVPMMAVVAAYGFQNIIKKWRTAGYILFTFALAESILNQQHDFFIPKDEKYKIQLSALSEKNIPANRKIIINSGPNIQQLYLCNRKGWTLDTPAVINKQVIDSLARNTNPYIVLDKKISTKYSSDEFQTIFSNNDYTILLSK